jgi:hypothetical protein
MDPRFRLLKTQRRNSKGRNLNFEECSRLHKEGPNNKKPN